MANRVLLGKRGSDYGLWVSKSGANVLTCGDSDMIFNSEVSEGSSVIKSGTLAITVGTSTNTDYYSSYVYYNLDGSNGALNYIPLVLIWDGHNSLPRRAAQRVIYQEPAPGGGRGPYHYQGIDANPLRVQADTYKFRLVSRAVGNNVICNQHSDSGTYRYLVLGVGGSSITSVGP
tara:strand:+ start:225 stop:749 length:525 start_codon:yes stop_codon:yes gene_type:complete